jgi:ComF family protein
MRSLTAFQQARSFLLDLVFPPRCQGCGRHGAWFCPLCVAALHRRVEPLCPRCGRELGGNSACASCRRQPLSPALDGIRSVAEFDGVLRNAIHALKYQRVRVLAEPFGMLLAEAAKSAPGRHSLIIPVPLHPEREQDRGFNQSALMAGVLGRLINIPVERQVLVRQRNTIPQVGLSEQQRRTNLLDAFRCIRQLDGQRILLVDDVSTTGTTLGECAQALRAAGADTIWGLTLAG